MLSLYVIAFRVAVAVPAFLANPITQTAFLDSSAAAPPDRRQPTYDHLRRVGSIGIVGGARLVVAAPLLPWVLGSDW